MKRMVLLVSFAALALGQQGNQVRNKDYDATALQISKDGSHLHLAGGVDFETDAIVLHADAADYDEATQEIKATGNVVVKLK